MLRKKSENDLEFGDINLLPEEMRSAEEKARKASSSKERLYQLRAPKKTKRRKYFAWLPFFGGPHWEVVDEERVTAAPPLHDKGISDVVARKELKVDGKEGVGAGASVHEREKGVKREAPTHIFPGVSSHIKTSPKKLFGFIDFSRFGRQRKPMHPLTPLGEHVREVKRSETVSSSFTPEARHYSLLTAETDEKGAGAQSSRKEMEILPGQEPLEPLGPRMKPIVEITEKISGVALQKKKGWPRMLRWFDIFYLLGIIVSRKPRRPAMEKRMIETDRNIRAPLYVHPMTPKLPAAEVKPIQREVIREVIKETPSITPIYEHAAQGEKKPKRKKTWIVPRWLDIFYLISLLKLKKRPPKSKPVAIKAQPREEAPKKTKSEILVTPVPTPAASVPLAPPKEIPEAPKPLVQDITPPQAPRAAEEKPAGISPITPLQSEGDATAKKKHPLKQKRGITFHMPRKVFGDAGAPDASVVNLIPLKYTIARSWRNIAQILIIAAIITIAVNALAFASLNFWQLQIEKRTTQIDEEILKYKNLILVYGQKYEPEMTQLGGRIDLINLLLGKHIYWTNFFKLLEKYTLPDVYYDGLSATTNGTLSLSAHGADFSTVSKLLKLLQSPEAKEFVTDARITSASLVEFDEGISEVTFSVELTLNSNLFYYDQAK